MFKIFVSNEHERISGNMRGIVSSEKAPGGYIFTFKYISDACEAMTVFRNSGYREVIALWQ